MPTTRGQIQEIKNSWKEWIQNFKTQTQVQLKQSIIRREQQTQVMTEQSSETES